jgi:chromosome segregation ATPase
MTKDSELSRLESFVEKLLAKFSELQVEKTQLEKDLAERDSAIEELRGNITTQDSERIEISQRVSKIVDQIEEWEQRLDGEGSATTDEYDSTPEEDDEDEDESVVEADEEGRIQHNLFSMEDSK